MVARYTKVILLLVVFGGWLPNWAVAQNTLRQSQADQLYPEVVFSELLEAEKERMDSLRAKFVEPDHIAAWRKVCITGTYQRQDRSIQTTTLAAASFSCRIFTGNTSLLRFFKEEHLFEVEGVQYWLPVSKTKVAALKSATRKGNNRLKLYGIFASRPNANGALEYTFLVEQFVVLAQ